MTRPPLVSVLMTAYNREAYIREAIESVLSQSFQDFELVVVDDRSSDRTLEIAHEYARRDPRVHVHANERNLGDYANRNRAASFARGEFLKFHDSDDIMYPHCLGVMVGYLAGTPEAAFALTAHRAWSGAACPIVSTPRLSYQREFLGSGMFNQGPANALFRKEVFEKLGAFQDVGPHSDVAFWLRVCRTVTAVLVPTDLYWYRIHEGQHLKSAKAAYDQAEALGFAWSALHHAECPLLPDELVIARQNVVYSCAKAAWRALRRGRPGVAVAWLRRSGLSLGDWIRYLRRPRRSPLAGVSS